MLVTPFVVSVVKPFLLIVSPSDYERQDHSIFPSYHVFILNFDLFNCAKYQDVQLDTIQILPNTKIRPRRNRNFVYK